MALGQLLFFELVPPEKYPRNIALASAVIGMALVIGPLIGGGITVNGDWRWVFLLKSVQVDHSFSHLLFWD